MKAAGGDPRDFALMKKDAAKGALAEEMKNCNEEQFTTTFAVAGYTCTEADLTTLAAAPEKEKTEAEKAAIEQAMKCTKAARKTCDTRAKKAFAEAGGDVKELRKAKAEAAMDDLRNGMDACLSGFLESDDAEQKQKLLDSDACKRIKCSEGEDIEEKLGS